MKFADEAAADTLTVWNSASSAGLALVKPLALGDRPGRQRGLDDDVSVAGPAF